MSLIKTLNDLEAKIAKGETDDGQGTGSTATGTENTDTNASGSGDAGSEAASRKQQSKSGGDEAAAGGDGKSKSSDSAGASGTGAEGGTDGDSGKKDTNEIVDENDKTLTTDEEDALKILTPEQKRVFFRMRRQLRESQSQLAREREAKKQTEAQPKQADPKTDDKKPAVDAVNDPEPNKADDYEAWLEWRDREKDRRIEMLAERVQSFEKKSTEKEQETKVRDDIQAAVNEFVEVGKEFAKEQPDYQQAMSHVWQRLRESYQVVHPEWTKEQLSFAINRAILVEAVNAANSDKNAAEHLYTLAQERFGYKKQAASVGGGVAKGEKPNLKLVENTRKRTASPLGAGGQGSTGTPSLNGMSLAEYSKLSEAERDAIEQAG